MSLEVYKKEEKHVSLADVNCNLWRMILNQNTEFHPQILIYTYLVSICVHIQQLNFVLT